MYTCLIIDDEYASLEVLTDLITDEPGLCLLRAFQNPLTALSEISNLEEKVDIIFMDVEMPEMNGMELAKLIRHKTDKLVFITAYKNYAYDSYEVSADAFLLKPISQVKFSNTSKKLFISALDSPILIKGLDKKNQLINLNPSKIIAIEAQSGGVIIYKINYKISSNSTLSEIAQLLSNRYGFHQIHRSFIISEKYIRTLERTTAILTNGLKVPIGRRYLNFYNSMVKKNIM